LPRLHLLPVLQGSAPVPTSPFARMAGTAWITQNAPLQQPNVSCRDYFTDLLAVLDSHAWHWAFYASMGACRSRTNADDRLPLASLGRVQGGDGIVESRDVADVRPQSSIPHPLDDLTQLGAIALDNEVDRKAVVGPRHGRPDDGHQCSSGPNQTCGPLPDVAADDIEH